MIKLTPVVRPSQHDDATERRLLREIRQLRTAVRSLTERSILAADDLRLLAQAPVSPDRLIEVAARLESTSLQARVQHLGAEDRPEEREALLRRLRNGKSALARFDKRDPA